VSRFLASVTAFLSWLALLGGASYVVFAIWQILHEHFTDTTLIAAAILFPVTLIAAPIYAIAELGDWRPAIMLVITVVVTTVLRTAKRNFERSA
jgi:hypothetical protein